MSSLRDPTGPAERKWRLVETNVSRLETAGKCLRSGFDPRFLPCGKRAAYRQRVARANAAAIPPMPMRMFQLPRAFMKGM
jgi:hypothetical protein